MAELSHKKTVDITLTVYAASLMTPTTELSLLVCKALPAPSLLLNDD